MVLYNQELSKFFVATLFFVVYTVGFLSVKSANLQHKNDLISQWIRISIYNITFRKVTITEQMVAV